MTSGSIKSFYLTDDPENVRGQMLSVFGQGTEQMKISAEAMAEVLQQWSPSLSSFVELWPTQGLHILERAREVGHEAAENARAEGRDTILGGDIPSIICLCLG